MPHSPGLRGSPRYPGSRTQRVPYPERGCAVRSRQDYDKQSRDGIRFNCAVDTGVQKRLLGIRITPNPLEAPVRSFGTTTFGVVAHFPPIPGVTPGTA